MKKNKSNLFRISFFVSLALHILAIASISHLEIRSYLTTGNISFSNKTALSNKKSPKEIINLVLKQKQKDIQSLIDNKQIVALPQKQKTKKKINDFTSNLEKQNFAFHLPSIDFKTNCLIKPKSTLSNQTYSEQTQSEQTWSEQTLPETESLFFSYTEKKLPEMKMEMQNLFIPFFELKNDKISTTQKINETSAIPSFESDKSASFNIDKEFCVNIKDLFKFKKLLDNNETLIEDLTKKTKKIPTLFPKHFSLISMPGLNDLATLPYKDYFDVEVLLSPKTNQKGYIFAITFIPKPSIKLPRLKQNIFFLVDRSNSIQKERLTNTRHAITSSLRFINKEDTFNILAFDNKLDVLSKINLKNDSISISRARSFLRNQNIGSFFFSTNFSIPLYKILDKNVKDNEINIAILLSNGDGLNKFKNNRIINDWTQTNKGNLSLFTICLDKDKNLPFLELFSALNKGKLIAANTTRGIKRKLQRLLKSTAAPIAKDIVANAICLDNKANIKLYPPSRQSPHLYIDAPYIILGTIEKLQDFTIFLQGKCKNNNFNLKKHISFDTVMQGGVTLQKELAMKQAFICYEKYLSDNNRGHLQEAKNHLKPFDIQPVFR